MYKNIVSTLMKLSWKNYNSFYDFMYRNQTKLCTYVICEISAKPHLLGKYLKW